MDVPITFLSNSRVIETQQALDDLVARIEIAPWLAIDTEADSLHSFPEKLCLIQISLPGEDHLIDPLVGLNLSSLFAIFRQRELIMHGSDYDLRLFKDHHDFLPTTLFDTMFAARLLGKAKFGLADLAANCLGVKLEKSGQKANWSKRPITPALQQYARDDTRHLKALSDLLRAELESKGRLDWHKQECDKLIRSTSQPQIPDSDSIWRIRGSAPLGASALAILRELWHWRNEEARQLNRPPFFVLSHDLMIHLADCASAGNGFEQHVPRRAPEPRRRRIIEAIERGLRVPSEVRPNPYQHPPRTHFTKQQRRRLDAVQKSRDDSAKTLCLDPTIIASRAMLTRIAMDETAQQELLPWQRACLQF